MRPSLAWGSSRSRRAPACGQTLTQRKERYDLGGEPAVVPAYTSLRSTTSSDAANEATKVVAAGGRAVKVRIGHASVRQDLVVAQTLRKSVGGAVEILVDYNQCLTPVEAVRRATVLDSEEIRWIEEPVRADDYAGHAIASSRPGSGVEWNDEAVRWLLVDNIGAP